MSFLKSLFIPLDPEKQKERERKRYEHEKKIAQSLDVAARMKLARSPATQAEILYYLAQHDNNAAVRTAVASNNSTPYQASPIIAADKSEDVRLALADRLVRLLPHLSSDEHSQLYAFTVNALETLASDEVSKVRIVLAQTLKKELAAPPQLISKLAHDIEREVAEPILHQCMAVSDDILLSIISSHPESWSVEAIAKRKSVSEEVSAAVIETDNEIAGKFLLDNKNAEISDNTLLKIVEKSKAFSLWQKPLAVRAFLPSDVAEKLAEFVDESVRSLILKRTDLDHKHSESIKSKFRKELNQLEEEELKQMDPEEKVRKFAMTGTLNEVNLLNALEQRDRKLVITSLSAMARTSIPNMERMLDMCKPKVVIALCWRAGLSMRTCLKIQQEVALIPSKELIYPRGGTDYPLDEAEIKWQLEFLGLA